MIAIHPSLAREDGGRSGYGDARPASGLGSSDAADIEEMAEHIDLGDRRQGMMGLLIPTDQVAEHLQVIRPVPIERAAIEEFVEDAASPLEFGVRLDRSQGEASDQLEVGFAGRPTRSAGAACIADRPGTDLRAPLRGLRSGSGHESILFPSSPVILPVGQYVTHVDLPAVE